MKIEEKCREKEELREWIRIPREWPKLPPELLISIAEQSHLADVARLPAVCGDWAWALGLARRECPPPPPALRATFLPYENSSPWLLLPNSNGNESEYCDFVRLSESRPRIRISPLPELAGRIFVGGSPDGWIVTVDKGLIPRILNPLNGEEFRLPYINPISRFNVTDQEWSERLPHIHGLLLPEKFRHSFIKKIILTSAPPHGIAFLIHRPDEGYASLAMARVGDLAWIPIVACKFYEDDIVEDIAYDKKDEKLYVIYYNGELVVLDLKNYQWQPGTLRVPEYTVAVRGGPRFPSYLPEKMYVFFTSAGDLLHVRKQYRPSSENNNEENDFNAINFEIFKFDSGYRDGKNSESCWVQVKDLGNVAIFLGLGPSICITTSDKPWLRRNSVYFVDESLTPDGSFPSYCACDEGIYHLKDDKIERFFSDHSKVNLLPPIWFVPSHLRLICDSF